MITSSATPNTTEAAPLGIAVRIGLKSAEIQVCEWVNDLIGLRDVGEPITSNYTSNNGAYPTKSMQDAINRALREHARRYVTDISRPMDIPVAVSFEAGTVSRDRKTLIIDEEAKTMFGAKRGRGVNFEMWMNRQAVGKFPDFNLRFHVKAETVQSPQAQSLEATVSANRDSLGLNDGDIVHEYILGDKLTGRAASLGPKGSLNYSSYEGDLSKEEMPMRTFSRVGDIPENHKLKGRNQPKELSIGHHTSGNSLATIADDLYSDYFSTNQSSPRLASLKRFLNIYDIQCDLQRKDLVNSQITSSKENWTAENIIDAEKKGDKLAKAILQVAAICSGHAIGKAITVQDGENRKPVSLLSLGGSFNTILRETVDPDGSLQLKAIKKALTSLGHPGIKGDDSTEGDDATRRVIVANPSQGVTDSLADAKTRLEAMFQNPQAV